MGVNFTTKQFMEEGQSTKELANGLSLEVPDRNHKMEVWYGQLKYHKGEKFTLEPLELMTIASCI